MKEQKRMSNNALIALNVPFMALIAIVMVALIVLSSVFASTISLFLYGVGKAEVDPKTLSDGSQLCEDIVEEGTVLLKNESGALPLKEDELKKINVFGWAAYDWMTSTFGSGFSNTALEKVKLFPALEEAGIEYNKTLYDMYKNFYSATTIGSRNWGKNDWNEYRGDVDVGTTKKFVLHEPDASYYTQAIIDEARAFSSVALVVIGRTGGEAADLRFEQTKQIQTNGSNSTVRDSTRSYLQISTEEEEMIAAAKKACDKVIVVLNTSNTMELGFLDDPDIDAALLVGLTGLTGVNALVDILGGKDAEGRAVSPSGRTADTYAYDISSAPSSVNSGYGGATKYTGLSTSNSYNKGYYDAYVDYHEGIYVGYRYYETAAAEGYIDFDETVQFPFGYGLSYTDFEWDVEAMLVNDKPVNLNAASLTLGMNDKIEIYVNVKNTGSRAGKEVVQLYYSAPYIRGGIEKSSVVLGDFAKTDVIEPGETKQVKLELTARGMASYDCYDDNKNDKTGYELDGGSYFLRLMKNSHEAGNMAGGEKSAFEFVAPEGGYHYENDEKTGNAVENRFTGEDTLDGYPIDGSKETTPVKYMTRANFAETFPKAKMVRSRSEAGYAVASAQAPTAEQLARTGFSDVDMPLTSNIPTYTVEDLEDVDGYDDPLWDSLLSQLSKSEMFELIRNGYFKTAKLDSIGKPEFVDLDGPLGLNTRVTSSTTNEFISYPSETLVAQTFNTDLAYAIGLSVGKEARNAKTADGRNLGIRGWYGPAANIHRNPYAGRNAEYYSEDALLSGKFTAETVRGAKNAGLYCYIKHFVANDSESLREGLYTFMTEQTFREIYLKPFEIAVKEGGANALMSSMNRIGATWVGASRALCTDLIKGEWGFNGSIVTDWVDTGHADYMPVYKGIWAGNSTWLNNADAQKMFSDSQYADNSVFVTLAQNVAHDVLWTLSDTNSVYSAYDPDADTSLSSGGFKYNHTWVVYIVLIEVVLAAGIGVMTFFLIRNIRRNNAEPKNS